MIINDWIDTTYQQLNHAVSLVSDIIDFTDLIPENNESLEWSDEELLEYQVVAGGLDIFLKKKEFIDQPQNVNNLNTLWIHALDLKSSLFEWRNIILDTKFKQNFSPIIECIEARLRSFNQSYH